MIGYAYDDGGRQASGRRGEASDCVCRALAIVSGRPYDECYKALAEANARYGKGKRSARNGVSRKAWPKVYEEFGLVKIHLGPGPRPTYSEAYYEHGDCVVSTTKHLAAIKGGKLRDTFDGRVYLNTFWYPGEEHECERKAMQVWVRA